MSPLISPYSHPPSSPDAASWLASGGNGPYTHAAGCADVPVRMSSGCPPGGGHHDRRPLRDRARGPRRSRHILDRPPGTGAWTDGCHRLLEGAASRLASGSVPMTRGILLWLAGWEPQACAVIAGLITREHGSEGR
jgi:hypothetical protein